MTCVNAHLVDWGESWENEMFGTRLLFGCVLSWKPEVRSTTYVFSCARSCPMALWGLKVVLSAIFSSYCVLRARYLSWVWFSSNPNWRISLVSRKDLVFIARATGFVLFLRGVYLEETSSLFLRRFWGYFRLDWLRFLQQRPYIVEGVCTCGLVNFAWCLL